MSMLLSRATLLWMCMPMLQKQPQTCHLYEKDLPPKNHPNVGKEEQVVQKVSNLEKATTTQQQQRATVQQRVHKHNHQWKWSIHPKVSLHNLSINQCPF